MLKLSLRLSVITGLIEAGGSVCDVGTDHGYLPAFLYLSGKFSKVTATDIRQKPLLTAEKNLKALNAKGVKLVLCDGLEKVSRGEADNVVIAGMGGEVISGIIDRAKFLKDPTVNIVLSPTTSASELRTYLLKNGFETVKETAVKENGKYYAVMKVKYTGAVSSPDFAQIYLGKLDLIDKTALEYAKKQLAIKQKLVLALSFTDKNRGEYIKAQKICAEIEKKISEAENGA